MSKCSRRHLQYFYNASAYGLAGEIERPMRHSIPAQAATTLAGSGGRGFQRVESFSATPFVSFDAAYTEVGGSFDECHNQHTTFAYSVIEGLNIAGMVTADRVVARMAIYSPSMNNGNEDGQPATRGEKLPKKTGRRNKVSTASTSGEHTFDITGSYFDNLRIAGQKIEVQLATHRLHQYQTYSDLSGAIRGGADDLLPWGDLDPGRLNKLEELEDEYHALSGFGTWARQWKKDKQSRSMDGMYWCSAAGHYDLKKDFPNTEMHGFGGIICVPKFGVVRLAEVVVHKDRRHLHMLRVDMCSTSGGGISGGGAGGSGGGSMPPP
ncbi:MAG: hypothetical protein WA738_18715 [Candidatus Angelobacter sp.]